MSLQGTSQTFKHAFARCLFAIAVCILVPSTLAAQLRLPTLSRNPKGANTSRQAREEAVRALPLDQISPQVGSKIRSVVDRPTIYRRLPTSTIECDRDLFVFLLRNPEVVVGIWDVMGATQIAMDRKGPFSFKATDGAGTTSDFQLVYGTQGLHIFYGDGLYEGTIVKKKIPGRAVLILRSKYHVDARGRQLVTNVLDMFVEMDNVTVDAIAKTFRPVIGHFADLNFKETVKFVSRLSEAAARNGPAVQRMAKRLTKVSPPVREQFSLVAGNVAGGSLTASRLSKHSRKTNQTTEDDILPVTANAGNSRDAKVQRISPNAVY